MEWFKLWSTGILRGSLSNSDDSTQLIWIKMLSMANETKGRNGRLEFAKGKPMPDDYITSYLRTTPDKFNKAIEQFKNELDNNGTPRITIEDDGTIVINKWSYYQIDNHHTRKKTPMPKKQKQGMTRSLVNKDPDTAIDTLTKDFGYVVIDKEGVIK